ncbi:MAG: DUF2779 domain-containing protein [Hyphomicrobiales bacterium]
MNNETISKTHFMQYLNCSKSLWLMLNKSDQYPHGEFSEYAKKLAAEGYLVEAYVQRLISSFSNTSHYSFQQEFETDGGLYAKADMVLQNEDGSIDLFEIKSSTSVKDNNPHNQLKDAAFQTIAAKQTGKNVRNILIVHLNGKYVRRGKIEPAEFLTFADVTVRVKALIPETENEIANALSLLKLDKIDETGCTCLHLSKSHHCDSFDYFNPQIPKPSIYNLPRLSAKKREAFVAEGRFSLNDISIDEVTSLQRPVLKSHLAGEPYVDLADIENFIGVLTYPLYHLDYETYASAIPIVDGTSPQAQLPFQFSLHVQQEDGVIEHHEFLANQPELPLALIEKMQNVIGPTGSVIVWNKGFENSQNKKMAALYPDKAEFLFNLIDRTVDLMDVFKTGYVDSSFGGSTSIKKVLPIVVPELSYEGMDVADGTSAMDAWKKMLDETDQTKRKALRNALLEYCKLDTLAMVCILRFIEQTNNAA